MSDCGRVDPLLAGCCLVALVVYVLHGFDGLLATDEGIYAYAGQQVAEGVPPYVAIANRVGPLAHLLPGGAAAVARVVGVDDLLAMRVFFMLISVACVGLAYLVGRDVFRSRSAGVASAAALLSLHGFIELATYGPREKTPMVLFMLAALLAIAHQRWLTTGVMVSLATLTWQPSFFPLILATLVAVLLGLSLRDWWRALARVDDRRTRASGVDRRRLSGDRPAPDVPGLLRAHQRQVHLRAAEVRAGRPRGRVAADGQALRRLDLGDLRRPRGAPGERRRRCGSAGGPRAAQRCTGRVRRRRAGGHLVDLPGPGRLAGCLPGLPVRRGRRRLAGADRRRPGPRQGGAGLDPGGRRDLHGHWCRLLRGRARRPPRAAARGPPRR